MTISSSINSGSGRSTPKVSRNYFESGNVATRNVTENMKKTVNLRRSEPPVLEDNESHSGIIFSYVSLQKK